jgi:hypothetical protein
MKVRVGLRFEADMVAVDETFSQLPTRTRVIDLVLPRAGAFIAKFSMETAPSSSAEFFLHRPIHGYESCHVLFQRGYCEHISSKLASRLSRDARVSARSSPSSDSYLDPFAPPNNSTILISFRCGISPSTVS